MPVFRAIIKRETNMDTHTTNLTYFEHPRERLKGKYRKSRILTGN